MSKKFWESYSIKQQPVSKGPTPASLITKLRAGRVDVSQMTQPQLASHMTDEAKLLGNIRDASGLPAVRPTQDEYDSVEGKFNLLDTAVTPPDATIVNRRKK